MVQFITEPNFSLYVNFNKQAVLIKFKNLCSQLVKALLQQAGYLVQRLQQLKRCRTCTLHQYYKNQFLRYGLVTTLLCEKKNDNNKKSIGTYIPLLTSTLCMVFLISWKSGLSSGLSTQQSFMSSRISSRPAISVVTVGRNDGNSASLTLRMMSTEIKINNFKQFIRMK